MHFGKKLERRSICCNGGDLIERGKPGQLTVYHNTRPSKEESGNWKAFSITLRRGK